MLSKPPYTFFSEIVKRPLNFVGCLQELCIKKHLPPPTYVTENCSGPTNNPRFSMFCEVGQIRENGIGGSKKIAKQMAAEKVLSQLEMR